MEKRTIISRYNTHAEAPGYDTLEGRKDWKDANDRGDGLLYVSMIMTTSWFFADPMGHSHLEPMNIHLVRREGE